MTPVDDGIQEPGSKLLFHPLKFGMRCEYCQKLYIYIQYIFTRMCAYNPSHISFGVYTYTYIPWESKDQTLPIGSRESFIWIILKTILCLVLDFQDIYMYISYIYIYIYQPIKGIPPQNIPQPCLPFLPPRQVTSQNGKGEGCSPVATKPEIWAMSAIK